MQERNCVDHQARNRPNAVNAHDMCVQHEPYAPCHVVVVAEWRKEEQCEMVADLSKGAPGSPARVDGVGVEAELDASRAAVLAQNPQHLLPEDLARSGRLVHAGELAGWCVQRPSDGALLVLDGRAHVAQVPPLPLRHPVAADLRVEWVVHLVVAEARLGGGRGSSEWALERECTLPACGAAGTRDRRHWHPEAGDDR